MAAQWRHTSSLQSNQGTTVLDRKGKVSSMALLSPIPMPTVPLFDLRTLGPCPKRRDLSVSGCSQPQTRRYSRSLVEGRGTDGTRAALGHHNRVSPVSSGAQSYPLPSQHRLSIMSLKPLWFFLPGLVYKLPPPRVKRNEVHNSTHYYPPVITSGLGLWTR